MGITIATFIAFYFTMFIMTYIGFYLYHRKKSIDGSHHRFPNNYMEEQQTDMVMNSLFWPASFVVLIFIHIVGFGSYVFKNFFTMLDSIGEKLFKSLPISKKDD